MIPAWIVLMFVATIAKVLLAPEPPTSLLEMLAMALPFLLMAAAPVIGFRLASGAFPKGRISAQPSFRLARYGSWRAASEDELGRGEIAGRAGFLVSLIVGILLNVPVRSMEYLAVVPAIKASAPGWAHLLSLLLTFDVVAMNLLYTVCFVMALRSMPLFPRMLLFAWILDILLQLGLASVASRSTDLPQFVGDAMAGFLTGNLKKVLASVIIWLPYLLLSDRVNLLFRHRVRVLQPARV